jgi:hypothetical protein
VDENVWKVQPRGARVTKQQSKHKCTGEELSREEQRGPQAGWSRPAGPPLSKAPWCSPSSGKSHIQLFVRVLKFVVQNHLRLSHPLRVCFAQQNAS